MKRLIAAAAVLTFSGVLGAQTPNPTSLFDHPADAHALNDVRADADDFHGFATHFPAAASASRRGDCSPSFGPGDVRVGRRAGRVPGDIVWF